MTNYDTTTASDATLDAIITAIIARADDLSITTLRYRTTTIELAMRPLRTDPIMRRLDDALFDALDTLDLDEQMLADRFDELS